MAGMITVSTFIAYIVANREYFDYDFAMSKLHGVTTMGTDWFLDDTSSHGPVDKLL